MNEHARKQANEVAGSTFRAAESLEFGPPEAPRRFRWERNGLFGEVGGDGKRPILQTDGRTHGVKADWFKLLGKLLADRHFSVNESLDGKLFNKETLRHCVKRLNDVLEPDRKPRESTCIRCDGSTYKFLWDVQPLGAQSGGRADLSPSLPGTTTPNRDTLHSIPPLERDGQSKSHAESADSTKMYEIEIGVEAGKPLNSADEVIDVQISVPTETVNRKHFLIRIGIGFTISLFLIGLIFRNMAVVASPFRAGYAAPRNTETARLYKEALRSLELCDPMRASSLLERATKAEPRSSLVRAALAEAYFTYGDENRARDQGRRAFEMAQKLTKADKEASLFIQARYSEILRKRDEAVQIYQTLWTFFPESADYGIRLARAQISANQGSAALGTLAEVRSRSTQAAGSPAIDLAEALASETLGQPEKELDASRRAIAGAERIGARLLMAQAQLRACWALDTLSRWEEALESCRAARGTFAEFGDHVSEAHAVKNIADVLDDRGNHTEAATVYAEALEAYRRIGYQRGIAVVLNNLGEANRGNGDLDAAQRNFAAALKIASEIGDYKLQAIIFNGIGSVYRRQGGLNGARNAYEKAVDGLKKSGDHDVLANSLLNLAEVFRDQGYFDDGLRQLEEALNLAKGAKDQGSQARILGAMGAILFLEADVVGARKQFEDQLELGRALPDEKQLAEALEGLGRISLVQGDYRGAESRAKQALDVRTKLDEKGLIAETRSVLAEIQIESNQPIAAAQNARLAASQFELEKEKDQEALALALLARSSMAGKSMSEAALATTRAAALLGNVHNQPRRLSIIAQLSRVKVAQGDIEPAVADLRSALDVAVKNRLVLNRLEIERVLCEIHPRQECTAELENEARDRGLILIAKSVAMFRTRELKTTSGKSVH